MEKNKEMAMEEAAKCYPAAEAEYQQVVENAELFFHKLTNFHSSFSNNFSSPSISIGGTSLDLHRLFVEVTSHGGLDQVIRDRKWKEVVSAFKLPLTSISKSFLLRKHYVSLLYHFEQVYFFRKSVSPLPIAEAVNKIPCIRSTAESASKVYKASTALSLLPDAAEGQRDTQSRPSPHKVYSSVESNLTVQEQISICPVVFIDLTQTLGERAISGLQACTLCMVMVLSLLRAAIQVKAYGTVAFQIRLQT